MHEPLNNQSIHARAREIYDDARQETCRKTDRLFAYLMVIQWLGGIVAAVWISPKTWIGTASETHLHVWASIFLGGAIAAFPIYLVWKMPGQALTRYVIAIAQMLFSALFIHLSGGRIESHFHVFGSLAFLAVYRDWRVLTIATVIVAGDHFGRGEFWPQSVFGVMTVNHWRWIEHAGWVVFEVIFLMISIRQGLKELYEAAVRRARLERMNVEIENKVAERTRELKNEQELLQTLMNNLPDFIYFKDAQARFVRINPALATRFGLACADQAVGRSEDDICHTPLSAEKLAEEQRVIATGEPIIDGLEQVDLPGGQVWLASTKVPIRNSGGKIVGLVGISRDITMQAQTQNALQQTNEQLEVASARANEMALKAEMANIAKSHFLANMSHEIRTPMNGIIGMTTLLLQTDLTPEQQQYTHLLKGSGESLLSLINDILDFSKIEAQKLSLEKLDFNLRETMEDAVELLAFKAAEKKLELACLISPEVPHGLRGDPLRLRQIFINLAGNAIKFTGEGGVYLSSTLLSQDEKSATIRFSIKDTGIGIPKERQQFLFTSFTQVDGSTTRKFGGTGLGLAISKQLTEMMGGQIGLESEPGKGTEFWFTVTLEKSSEVPAEKPLFSGASVLIFEKHSASRRSMAQALQRIGCNFSEAENLADAENQLSQRTAAGEPFSIVLAGSHDGSDAADSISRLIRIPRFSSTRFIRLAPFGSRVNADELKSGDFSGQLNLPFRLTQLVSCLAQVLQKKDIASPVARTLTNVSTTPLRILVVDDNNTNLIVICKILEKLGQKPSPVAGGAEAIAALLHPDFDLVFMDCQMPDMDGYEATRRIREGEAGAGNKTIPVIALTANVLADDQQRCLDAGMDGYLGKPIQIEELKAVLERWKPRNASGETPDELPSDASNPILASDYVSSTGKLVFNRPDMMNRMLEDMEMAVLTAQAFIDDFPKQIAAIKAAAQKGDPAATASAAHRLKGAAGTIGGDALYHLLGDIERCGHQKDMAGISRFIARIDEESAALAHELQEQILNAPPDPCGVPFPV